MLLQSQRRRDGSCGTAARTETPPAVAKSVLVAVVVRPEDCTACGSCVDACPRDAIAVDDVARIDGARCNGCGACVTECPNGALQLAEA